MGKMHRLQRESGWVTSRAAGPELASDAALCPRMPVLDTLREQAGAMCGNVDYLFGLQHLFGSTASLIKTLIGGRIRPERVFLLGKPYSANREVMRFLREQWGCWVHPRSCDQPVGKENDSEMDRRITAVLTMIREQLHAEPHVTGRVVLVDDGARAIRQLHTPAFASVRDRFTCVEQTRAGIRHLEDIDLEVPVINVAESRVKLEYESPMIAQSVIDELGRKIDRMHTAGIATSHRALIIGYGAIGKAVAQALQRRGRRVSVFDADPAMRNNAHADGFHVFSELRLALASGGIIIGCTGKPVIDQSDHCAIADGAVLVSASSADVEYRAWQMRPRAECLGNPLRWGHHGADSRIESDDTHPCFSLYRVPNGEGHFYLVNGGFPVNFTGGVDPISPAQIQLTRALLYLGAVQASYCETRGLHELDDHSQHKLIFAFDEQNGVRAA